mmetsp:Transcript_22640/g.52514  ORF Transcript_22640/g.52514 Transcript_22640/m.52514 type:complete len:277 (-) Transcript_22640:217-1047(-)
MDGGRSCTTQVPALLDLSSAAKGLRCATHQPPIHLPHPVYSSLPLFPQRPPDRCMKADLPERLVVDEGLHHRASDGQHGQPAVSDLLRLQFKHLSIRLVLQERGTEVEVTRRARAVVGLVEGDELDDGESEEDLGLRGNAELLNGVERVGADLGKHRQVELLLHKETHDGQLRDAAVLELGGADVVEVLEGVRDAHRVEASVAHEGAVELLRALEERKRLRLGVEGHRGARHRRRREGRHTSNGDESDEELESGWVLEGERVSFGHTFRRPVGRGL